MDRKKKAEEELKQYPCPKTDDLKTLGVLLSDEIEYYIKKYKMIDPFESQNLKPAAYELRVGEEYSIGGKIEKLSDEPNKNIIRIPPFEVVIIYTKEKINLPRFLIARWNIRVKWAYKGLLWVGGPQVDPGWIGHLPCPIYNLSNKEIILRLNEPIAVIDFTKTASFKEGKSKKYSRPPKRTVFEDYNPEELKSALYTETKEHIDNIESKLKAYLGIIFTTIVIVVAALAILVTSAQKAIVSLPTWLYFFAALSIVALLFSLSPRTSKELGVTRFKKFVAIYIIISAIAIIFLAVKVLW